MGLAVWDNPNRRAPSRIPHGSEVTRTKLSQVERGEAWLREAFGLRVVRLRHEGERARIEVRPTAVPRLLEPAVLASISLQLKELGFSKVEVDPRGYRRPDPNPADPLEESSHGKSR
jgi:uncharacterized protein